ncbi:histidine kinase [Geomonas sp. Red276]
MPAVSPDTPLYNSRIFDSFLKLVQDRYPRVDTGELLAYAGMQDHEVADPGHWFTQTQADLFYEKLVVMSGNRGIAREAGRYAAVSDSFMRDILSGFTSPEILFSLLDRFSVNFSRSFRSATRKVGPRTIEVTVTYREGVEEKLYQCQNRMGYFEAVFLLLKRDCESIEHPECIFHGGAVCRYRITWRETKASRLVTAHRFTLATLLLSAPALLLHGLTPLVAASLLLPIPAYLVVFFLAWRSERSYLIASFERGRELSLRHLALAQENYDNALLINQIGEAISRKTELDDVLATVNQILLKRLNYGRGIIMLANENGDALVLRSWFGLSDHERMSLERREHALIDDRPKCLLARCYLDKRPVLVNESREGMLPEHCLFYSVKSFLCVPILCEGESLGILVVDDPDRKGDLLQSDLNLVNGVASMIGVAVRNAMRLANERRLAEELRGASELLERRVDERTAELRQAREELELLYDSMTHDLRTPLRLIYGYGDLLLEAYQEKLDDTAKGYLSSMIDGGARIEAILDRILDFSGMRASELKVERVDLSEMAGKILEGLQVAEQGREVGIRIQPGVAVDGDRALLQSVLENLLGNAWKYSAKTPSATISFGCEDGVCFVRDNGPGFDMKLAERLFMPFQRLCDRDTFAGHGLGLAIVKRSLARMGGEIWCDSTAGAGASFYFTLAVNSTLPPTPPLVEGLNMSEVTSNSLSG